MDVGTILLAVVGVLVVGFLYAAAYRISKDVKEDSDWQPRRHK